MVAVAAIVVWESYRVGTMLGRADQRLVGLAWDYHRRIEQTRARGTARSLASFVRTHIDPDLRWRRLRVCDWTAADLEAWLRWRVDQDDAPKTVRKYLSYWTGIGDYAVSRGQLAKNPARLIDRSILPRNRVVDDTRAAAEVLSLPDIARLIRSPLIPFERRALWCAALTTGMRPGELFGQEWRDLDDGGLCIRRQHNRGRTLPTKTTATHWVPLHAELERDLVALAIRFAAVFGRPHQPDDPIFWRAKPWREVGRWTHTTALRKWHADLELLGIAHPASGKRRLHATRHTFISRLLAAGAQAIHVERLTHAPSKRTAFSYYVHHDRDRLRATVAQLNLPEVDLSPPAQLDLPFGR